MNEIEVIISNSHVNNKMELTEIAMINLLQDIEGIHISHLKEFSKYLNENNCGVFLTYRQIDILKKPKFGDKLKLTTYPFNTKSASGYRHIYIKDVNNSPLVVTTAFGAFVNLETNRPVRVPKEIIKTIVDFDADPNIEVLPRKIEYNIDNEQFLEKIIIKKSHIDRYNHVNNSHYVAFALDSYQREIKFNRIRSEYLKSFVLNDECYIYLVEENSEKTTFKLQNNQKEVCAIIEFSNI
ncbi:MAG TPA: hypothetical protein GX012_03500 [Acholeplasma sp.]|nr:hypothetical protein [Acholeplasma sp.]